MLTNNKTNNPQRKQWSILEHHDGWRGRKCRRLKKREKKRGWCCGVKLQVQFYSSLSAERPPSLCSARSVCLMSAQEAPRLLAVILWVFQNVWCSLNWTAWRAAVLHLKRSSPSSGRNRLGVGCCVQCAMHHALSPSSIMQTGALSYIFASLSPQIDSSDGKCHNLGQGIAYIR